MKLADREAQPLHLFNHTAGVLFCTAGMGTDDIGGKTSLFLEFFTNLSEEFDKADQPIMAFLVHKNQDVSLGVLRGDF